MNEIFFLVDEAPEGGYAAKALGESIFTEADTLDELHANVRDAVRCHFEEGKAPKRWGSSSSSKGQSKSVL
ncbi:MAG TPA: hypothetical protein VEM32_02550 [Geobacteraceae bacterium]|nr:hypothetical protein [Geobacteraceae bacterium]